MISFENVTMKYGKTVAIQNLQLVLEDKKIYCLLGRNGAGKTTLMKLIAGKRAATKGEVSINGGKVDTLRMPENVTYIETAKRQFNMKIAQLLELASGLNEEFDMEFALHMVDKFQLDKNKKYNSLSFGMKTMVTTLLSLAGNQEILLLDEPVLGFDAIMRTRFYDLLLESYERRPRIILISTHLIDEIAKVAQQIIMIEKGKIILNDDISNVEEKAYKVSGPTEQVTKMTEGLNVIDREEYGKYTNCYIYGERMEEWGEVTIGNASLQELFVKMVGGSDDDKYR